jgi:hypothetical protein
MFGRTESPEQLVYFAVFRIYLDLVPMRVVMPTPKTIVVFK